MHRIDGPGATPNNMFTDGDPVGGVAATVVTDDWMNDVQENIMAVLAAASITPVKGRTTDLLSALKGRLLRTSVYTLIGGVQMVSVNGAAFTATGAASWTRLPLTTLLDYEVQGAGASGAGCGAAGANQISIAGGGAGGTYARNILASGLPDSLGVSVGAGGAGVAAGPGTAGGTSSFGGLLASPGGSGSATGSTVTPGSTPFIAGGTAQSGAPTGNRLYAEMGGEGTYGAFFSSNGFVSGHGGSSHFGSGGAPVSLYANGNPGFNYGSGGSGALSTAGNGSSIGGNGKEGIIIVREYA